MNLLTLLILVTFLFFVSVSAGPCPRKCSCHSSWLRGITSVVVDCSKKKLTYVPTRRTDRYMTSFVLNENFITELPANVFKRYRYLRELYLYKNFITKIHKDAFRGLSRLKELSLHSNQIKRIEKGTFRDLRSLRKLYLFTNFVEEINPGTFDGLKKVETVLLHENLLRRIPKDTFMPLERLRVMTLYRNYLGTLHTGSLNGLKSIFQLYLHENKMSRIEKDAFKGTPELRTLQLGNNYLNILTNESFLGLNNLLELNLDNNRIRRLDPKMFDSLPQVRKLVLLGNRIADLEPRTFENLRGLTLLSISKNNLTRLRPGMFAGLIELKRLFLQNNAIEWIEPFTFTGLINLRSLYLFRNRIFYVQEKTFYGLFALAELNLGVNNITGLANGAFFGLPRLWSLQLNSNRLKMLTAGAFSKLRNLYRLVLYFNRIQYLDKHVFDNLKRLRHITWYPPLALVRSSKILRALQSNNLHCDCNIIHVKNILQKQRISSAILCASPPYLRRSNVTRLSDHYLKCDEISLKISPNYVMTEANTDVILKCITNIAASFMWMRNGKPFKSSYEAFQMTSGILLLRQISVARSGQYTCLATGETGTSAVSALVKIGARPNITNPTGDVMFITKYEQLLVINCTVSGYPPPLITWYKDDEPLIKDNPFVFISFNQSIVIAKATAKDAGKYKCVARNQLGVDMKTINLVFTHASSPCQPMCGAGSSCVMRFDCLAPNQTRKQCSEVKYTTAIDKSVNTSAKNESGDVDGSGTGSGDNANVISDDEEGDVSENGVEVETSLGSEEPNVERVVTTTSTTPVVRQEKQVTPFIFPIPSR